MTVRFVADENFNRAILVGVQRRAEHIDVARVQDVGLRTADDRVILQWAADEGRVLVTHDIQTIPDFAHERVSAACRCSDRSRARLRCEERRRLAKLSAEGRTGRPLAA